VSVLLVQVQCQVWVSCWCRCRV